MLSPGALAVTQGWAQFLLCLHHFPAICLLCPHPPKPHISLHSSSLFWEKSVLEGQSWLGWRSRLLFPSRIQPFWSSPGSDPHMEPLPAACSLAPNPSILLRLRQAAQLWPVASDSWERWKPIPLVVPAMGSLNDGICPCPPPFCHHSSVVMDGDAFHLRLGPVGSQFAQPCPQLQPGAEQPLWWQWLAPQEGLLACAWVTWC